MIADIIVKDSKESDVLIVKVKASVPSEDSIAAYLQDLKEAAPTIPFSMLVSLNVIRIAKHNASGSTLNLDAKDVLGYYDQEFSEKRIFHDYLEALTEAWLSDIADHWKSEKPPGSEALDDFGLLEKLEDARMRFEVELAGDSVR